MENIELKQEIKNYQNNTLNRFEIDIKNEKCWWHLGATKIEIPNENKGNSRVNYGIYWDKIDGENKDHWINYSITHSQGKNWINPWYKKVWKDSSGVIHRVYYQKKKIPYENDLIVIEFDYRDEMIKITDPEQLTTESQKQKGYKWVNRLDWEKENRNEK